MPHAAPHHATPNNKTKKHDVRLTSTQRGYGHRWRKARGDYLKKHPLCVRCEAKGIVKPANVVDHIIPHKGCKARFWDSSGNWQPLCKYHHDQKTANEDGGFGRNNSAQKQP